jgi:DNA-binding NarL/FixJ family response regulator
MNIIRVLITDDHPVVREGLAGMLAGQQDFEVVGLAEDGDTAVALHQTLSPDVTLMDLQMPGLDGVGAIEAIKVKQPSAHILVLTTYDSDADIIRAIEAGATGYLLKDSPREELFRAVRATAQGDSVLAPTVAARLMTQMRAPAEDSLSAREIEVIQLVAKGKSNKDVGKELHISTATVKTHLIHIYNKLGVDDPKGVSFRSTPPQVSEGQHEPIISEELWQRSQAMRSSRRATVKTIKKTVRVNLLQGLVVCANCGRRLRIQTPKNCPTYYREESHLRGYHDCPYIGQSMRADLIDDQVAELIRSIHLPDNWEPIVRQMLDNQRERADPEAERKEIRGMLRLMRDNFERGLYEGEEYQYWQKVSGLKEKLALLERVPEPALNRAARTLLDLRVTWESTTKEERKDLVHIMIQEVGVDVEIKRVLWVKARPDYEPLFSILDGLRHDADRRFWIESFVTPEDNCDVEEDTGQVSTGVEIVLQMSHNTLTRAEEYI